MKAASKHAVLDAFRLAAALLVIAIHISPLQNISPTGDFILTRVLARVAVPFFLMMTGYFLAARDASGGGRYFPAFIKKTALLYGAAVLLYLPLNLYNGYFRSSPLQLLRDLLLNGTFYHLWYLPAVLLGAVIARAFWLHFGMRAALAVSLALYAIGLGGDSYYGLAAHLPLLKSFYSAVFSLFDYTRNGLFLAPVFLTAGAYLHSNKSASSRPDTGALSCRALVAGLAGSVLLLAGEALWLHDLGVQRHDSMYIMLLPVMYFLFSLLLRLDGRGDKRLRSGAMLVYIAHPWVIVLFRGFARITGTTALLVENRLILYLLVCALSCALAAALLSLRAFPRKSSLSGKERAWIEISRAALRHNAGALQQLLPSCCRLMAVLKADAYGHGAVEAAGEFAKSGIAHFAVATLSEGIALRKSGVRGDLLILGYTPPEDARQLRRYKLAQTAVDAAYAEALYKTGERLDIHIKLDTGMHRLGFDFSNLSEIERIFSFDTLTVKGTFTHLSRADDLSDGSVDFTLSQISRFIDTVQSLKAKGYPVGAVHIQESYGILNYPGLPCDYARAGIALYGVLAQNGETRLTPELIPALSLKARIAEVKWVGQGESVGYGKHFTVGAPTKIAAVTIGYADGIPRNAADGHACVLVRGQRASIIGLVCMDLLIIDVTCVDSVGPGDIVTLIGCDGDETIRCEDAAERFGTISNELLSRLGTRLPRLYY